MGLLVASVLCLFLNHKTGNKILATMFISFVAFFYVIKVSHFLDVQTVIYLYCAFTSFLCMTALVVSRNTLWIFTSAVVTTIIQLIYIEILLFNNWHLNLGMWFLLHADKIFSYGLFFIYYEQRTSLNPLHLSFKDYMINVGIMMSLLFL